MLGRWRCGLSIGAVGCALLHTCPLQAQELGPTLLSYRAPNGCPSAAEFQRSVQRRSSRVRFVAEGSHDRQLSITMRKDGGFTHGELRLIEVDGSLRQRHVRFTTCSEAVEGLALIAVVSLDPQALLEPEKPAEPAPGPANAPATASTPASTPAPAREAKPPPTATKLPPNLDPGPAAPQKGMQLALGAEFNVAFRALPATALGGSLFVDVAPHSESWFAPLFRGAISHVERRGLSRGDAEANFTLTLLTVSACPLRLASGFLVWRSCAFASGGALHAWGSQTTNLQQRTRPYGALGGSAMLFGQISQSVEIVADLAVGASLVRDSFGFDQEQPWETPALYLSSGIGARFVFR